MNEIDVSLSQEVANQASKEINDLKQTVEANKDAHISLLQDVLGDMRDQRKFLKTISMFLCVLSLVLVCGICVLGVWNQIILKRIAENNVSTFVEFVSSLDIKGVKQKQ